MEKIDLVRDRTGVSYKEAKEILEATNGDVIEAIIMLEERQNMKWTDNISGAGNEVLEKLKRIVKMGNVTKILLKRDGQVVLNIPVTAGAIGAMLSPPVAMAGVLTALVTKCRIEIVKTDGEVVDINEVAEETLNTVKDRMYEMKDKINMDKTKDEDKKDE